VRTNHPAIPANRRPRIVDSTLREGEQFALAHFSSEDRLSIARALDDFGVDVIELTSPAASGRAEADLRTIAAAGLRASVVTHVRCHLDDLRLALDCGVDGVHMFLGSSAWLRSHGHGRELPRMLGDLESALELTRDHGVPARFSCEDAFRTDLEDVLALCGHAEALGATRIGLADTVGQADPERVTQLVSAVRAVVQCEIEFHGHNDGGCAIANAAAAWRAGATHIDTTVLGIGERNGITPLAGLIARLTLSDPDSCTDLALGQLVALDQLVARILGIDIPFDACISAPAAFTHKAGLHAKAVLSDPRCYEALDPALFGRTNTLPLGHALIGRHALAARARALDLMLTAEQLAAVALGVKRQADIQSISDEQVDALLRAAAFPTQDQDRNQELELTS
jgi:homocitrate synthase